MKYYYLYVTRQKEKELTVEFNFSPQESNKPNVVHENVQQIGRKNLSEELKMSFFSGMICILS